MSAKAAYEQAHPYRSHLSTLPAELWMVILQEATQIDTIPLADNILWKIDTHGFARWAGSASHDALCRSMVTRRSIVLACVAWNHIATPFLYEWIYVRRLHRLQALDAILSAESTSVRRKPLAQYVRRLDVATRESLREHHFDAFLRVVRSLTHLEIFHAFIWHSSYFPLSCLSDLIRPSASKLKVFNLCVWSEPLAPSIPSGSALQLTMPRLQRCMIPFSLVNAAFAAPMITTLEFPHGFHPDKISRSIIFEGSQNTAPLHVIVNFSRAWRSFTIGEMFLAAEGAWLTSIEFMLDRADCLSWILLILCRECPRLATLILSYYKWEIAGIDLTSAPCVADPGMPESLETLGLRTQTFQSPASHFKKIASALETMTAPRLESVKLTEYRDIQHLVRFHKAQFLNLLHVVEARGWRLEDKIGNRLYSGMDIA